MLQSFSHVVLYFVLYSVAGWLCETLYCSVPQGRFVNRGFLRGPYCPIYGMGAFLILLVCEPVRNSPVLVFLLSALSATLLEYVTGWLLEKLFHIRWWDYSGKRFQLNGRICLKNSILFGGLGVAVVYLAHPAAIALVGAIPERWLRMSANGLTALFSLDLLVTIARLTGFAGKLQHLQEDIQELGGFHRHRGWFDSRDLEGSLRRLTELRLPEAERRAWAAKLQSVLERCRGGIPQLKSYRDARAGRFSEALEAVQQQLKSRQGWNLGKLRQSAGRIGAKTTAAGRTTAKSVWANLRFYQLFWVFLFAGVLGYLVESLYCLLTTGVVESRQGLLYGPFNQVYGFGAVLLAVLIGPLSGKNDRWVFAGSAALGGGFETLCSWLQEKAFGSMSWQYADGAGSLVGGRTSLLFMFFWGILGLWFIKGLYPRMLTLVERIPRSWVRGMTGVLSVLLIANMLLTSAAVLRWSERIDGQAAHGAVDAYLDSRYPDEFMQTVYPNMTWPEQDR